MSQTRTGPLIGATWLIGLGIVLLVQRAADLPWSQAWPMLVILIGVAMLVTAIIGRRWEYGGLWSFTWPVAWIVVGSLLLASTTGSIGIQPAELITTYWPWALVILGIWFVIGAFVPSGRRVTEDLSVPLDGALDAAIRIRYGAGTLTVGTAAPGHLVDGTCLGGVIVRTTEAGRVDLSQDTRNGLPWLDHPSRWTIGLSAEVPLDLKLDVGASRTQLDLAEMRLRSLDLQTGASETHVRLPRAGGLTRVTANAGAASLTFEVPAGVAARIRTRMALGSAQIDETRFPPAVGGYESPEFATATDRVEIDVQGGVGSLRIVGDGA
ncbi:MAG: hypothetical protein ACJ776_08875 [Chloroflexota bacterium]